MEIEPLLKLSLDMKASDLHVVAGLKPIMRVDGDLTPVTNYAVITPEKAKQMFYEFMSPAQTEHFEKHLSVDMAVHFPQLGNFRVNVFHQKNGLAAVFRIVPEKVPTLEDTNAPPILKRLLTMPHGIILVTGATGSGKSTTLASMVNFINANRSCHIITIEDPIEFVHNSSRSTVNQLQLGRDTESFATALRASLRQDPDVIMLGEMRDLESIRLALMAAETGHLVLSTLHASSASITISRIVDIFPTEERNRVRNILSETIQGVVCQSLVKRVSGGRVAAYEVLLATPAVRHLIGQGMTSHLESTMQTSGDSGMFTMELYLKELLAKGFITKATCNLVTAERDALRFAEAGDKNLMGGTRTGMQRGPVKPS